MFSRRTLITEARKFTRVPSKRVYSDLSYFLQEDLGVPDVENQEDSLLIVAKKRIMGVIGIKAEIRVRPEGEASTIETNFSYRNFLAAVLALLSIIILLSAIFLSFIPLFGIIPLIILMQTLGSSVRSFAASISEFLLLLEKNYAQQKLKEARIRWQADTRSTGDLYDRLVAAHTEIWGHAGVLEYKISEYMEEGLTREEAIHKVAEEEGISRS